MPIKVRHNPKKWARNAGNAGPSYKEGTDNPKRPWLESAVDGEANFAAVMPVVVSEERRRKGIEKVGQRKYDFGVDKKGLPRYLQGVGLKESEDNYDVGFKPFADEISRLDLPPKQPAGQHLGRVRVIQDALIAKKAALLG